MTDDSEESSDRWKKLADAAGEYLLKKKSEDAVAAPLSRRRYPKKWKYRLVKFDRGPRSDQQFEEEINKLGEKGWELIAIVNPIWVFKRPE